MNRVLLDLYSDYLVCSFGQATATGLSRLVDDRVSHDQITRFLASEEMNSAQLWRQVKPLVRQVQRPDAVVVIDDTIVEKPWTDQSELICWHYDHTKGHTVKGINLLSSLYVVGDIRLPVGFDLITKTEEYVEKETGQHKFRSARSKNDYYRDRVRACVQNQIPFQYVLNDVWYSSAENMRFVKRDLKKDFIMPLKTNRKVALSAQDKLNGRYQNIESLELAEGDHRTVLLEQVPFPIVLITKVFVNKDGSRGILYLASSDTELTFDQIFDLYRKRWSVEEYHKSLKQNVALSKSPAHTVLTQSNHIFCSLCALVRLEQMKIKTNCSHYVLKGKIYLAAIQKAYQQLTNIRKQLATGFA